MPNPPKCGPTGEVRPRQTVAVEIRDDLLNVIRNQFYPDAEPGEFQKARPFLLKNVVLWPAGYLDRRGVTLPPERYKAIVLEVIQGIKQHGQTGAIKYWPGYLMKCVQDHFKHHGEEYYEEGKALRGSLAQVLKRVSKVPTVDPVRALAEARRDLLQNQRRQTPKKAKTADQLPLFQLLCIASANALF